MEPLPRPWAADIPTSLRCFPGFEGCLHWSLLKLRVQGGPFCLLARKLQGKKGAQEKGH